MKNYLKNHIQTFILTMTLLAGIAHYLPTHATPRNPNREAQIFVQKNSVPHLQKQRWDKIFLGNYINHNLLINGDFSDEYQHWYVGGGEADASNGSLCVTITSETVNPWDAQIGQGEFALSKRSTYQIEFDMQASAPVTITLLIGQNQEPWEQFYSTTLRVQPTQESYTYQFDMTAADNANSLFALHIGGVDADEFCIDNVSVTDLDHTRSLGPIIFDDFEYNSEQLGIDANNGTHSIFGANSWTTADGEINSRFWRRYNWDDLDLGPNVLLDPTTAGMNLTALPQFSTDERDPTIYTGVVFPNNGSGTYHSRLKFDDLEDGIRAIQAFWTYSLNRYAFTDERGTYIPEGMVRGYASETDIEWNNWFDGDGTSKLSSANHLGSGRFVNANLQCLYRDAQETITHYPDCIDTSENSPLIANLWIDAMIVIDDANKTIAYSLWIENWDSQGGALWIGGPRENPEWGSPMVLTEYFPVTPMVAVYSQHFFPPEGEDQALLSQAHGLEIDYFYYSPRTNLTPALLAEDIARLRAAGEVRVNTTALLYQDKHSGSPYELFIDGPDVIQSGETGRWQLSTSLTSSRFDTQYRYRLRNQAEWGDWTFVDNMTFSLVADGSFDQVEIEATTSNYWHENQVKSKTLLVQVSGTNAGEARNPLYIPFVYR